MMRAEPWQTAEIPGPIKSIVLPDAKRVANVLKAAKRPLIIVGYSIINYKSDEFDPIDFIVSLAKMINAHINVTNTLIKEFRNKGYDKIYFMTTPEIIDRVKDPEWKGHDGEGNYDLLVFIGFPYYYEWLMLNGIKHFGYRGLRTISLDPYYQPNSTFSLLNMPLDKYFNFMRELLDIIRR